MSSEIPTISITHAVINGNVSSESSSEEEDSIADFPGGVTDVEDFNSHDEASDEEDGSPRLTKYLRRKSLAAGVTDVEDYEDSASDDEKSEVPEIKLSLREFLDHGSIEEEFHNADGMKTRSAVKIGKKNSTLPNNLGIAMKDDDAVTDCENYNTSGDEISEIDDNMIETNFTQYFADTGSLKMADKFGENVNRKKPKVHQKRHNREPELSDAESDNINETASDDNSDTNSDGDMSYSNADISYSSDAEGAMGGGAVSEVEDLLCSGAEEINFQGSDTSDIDSDSAYEDYPKIDVKFIATYTKNRPHKLKKPIKNINSTQSTSNYLYISSASDGPLTDIEKLDDSQPEEDESEERCGIYIAKVVMPQESQTDLEDFEVGNDVAKEMLKFTQVNSKLIPSAVRELVKVHENTNGDPVTSVEPLNDDLEIGLHDYEHELNRTDEEEISEIDADILMCDRKLLRRNSPFFIDNEIISNQESVKTLSVRRSDNIEEPITDVEELFMSGTVRRKKPVKPKNSNRTKVQRISAAKSTSNINEEKTDVEEMNLSDFENSKIAQMKMTKSKSENILPTSFAAIEAVQCLNFRSQSPEPKTDIENVSGDDDASISDVDQQKSTSDVEFLGNENYISTISSRDALTERGSQIYRKPSPAIFLQQLIQNEVESENNSQYVTDVEDVALQSDVEDLIPFNINITNDIDVIAANQFDAVLQDCSHSVVHEKSQNCFNIEKERDHIKGMCQLSDTYTDVEYIEEEIAKEAKEN